MAEFTAKGANILVVDDDDDIREIVHILLAREGFTVREAANAEQALRRLDPLPDLVILDVMMPGLSGIELCREIRTKAMMPILFLSAKTRDVDKAEGLANGGDDYLIKPFSALELTSRVKALLRRSMVYQPQTAAAPPQTVQSGELSIDLTTGADGGNRGFCKGQQREGHLLGGACQPQSGADHCRCYRRTDAGAEPAGGADR